MIEALRTLRVFRHFQNSNVDVVPGEVVDHDSDKQEDGQDDPCWHPMRTDAKHDCVKYGKLFDKLL